MYFIHLQNSSYFVKRIMEQYFQKERIFGDNQQAVSRVLEDAFLHVEQDFKGVQYKYISDMIDYIMRQVDDNDAQNKTLFSAIDILLCELDCQIYDNDDVQRLLVRIASQFYKKDYESMLSIADESESEDLEEQIVIEKEIRKMLFSTYDPDIPDDPLWGWDLPDSVDEIDFWGE